MNTNKIEHWIPLALVCLVSVTLAGGARAEFPDDWHCGGHTVEPWSDDAICGAETACSCNGACGYDYFNQEYACYLDEHVNANLTAVTDTDGADILIWGNDDTGAKFCCDDITLANVVKPIRITTEGEVWFVKLQHGAYQWEETTTINLGDSDDGNGHVSYFRGSDYADDCGKLDGEDEWCDKILVGIGGWSVNAEGGGDLILVTDDTDNVSNTSRSYAGGAGNDKLMGGRAGADFYGDGDPGDQYYDDEECDGISCNDVIQTGYGDDTGSGGPGQDWVGGDQDSDTLYGNLEDDGDDTSDGAEDYLCGGDATDTINGYSSDGDECANTGDNFDNCAETLTYCSDLAGYPPE